MKTNDVVEWARKNLRERERKQNIDRYQAFWMSRNDPPPEEWDDDDEL